MEESEMFRANEILEKAQKKHNIGELLFEALDLINELDENIGIETNNSFTMDFEMLRKKIIGIIDLRK